MDIWPECTVSNGSNSLRESIQAVVDAIHNCISARDNVTELVSNDQLPFELPNGTHLLALLRYNGITEIGQGSFLIMVVANRGSIVIESGAERPPTLGKPGARVYKFVDAVASFNEIKAIVVRVI